MNARRVAIVTGISGQDGSYLAEELLARGYEVHGTCRGKDGVVPRVAELDRLAHLDGRITLHPIDIVDFEAVRELLKQVHPHEVYNLAAQSSVGLSWKRPIETGEVTALGVTRILEAIRSVDPSIRFYQAGSSEMFGKIEESPQDERTLFRPVSPYGAAKVYGHMITASYRESFGMFCCSGILFNHESPRRSVDFVSRKITRTVAEIRHGRANELRLGNLAAQRDWGFAGDYVKAMYLMLQQDEPRDYVVGTGVVHSVRDFVQAAFDHVGLDWRDHVVVDPAFYRPADPKLVVADPTAAREQLGWEPEVSFEELVRMMVDTDLAIVREEIATESERALPSRRVA